MKYLKHLSLLPAVVLFCTSAFTVSALSDDTLDVTFNARIETTSYLSKYVELLIPQPDGKVLATGMFNRYNDEPVGMLIRINPDGSLDGSFNNSLVKSGYVRPFPLPNGKTILYGSFGVDTGAQYTNGLIRINTDGTIDETFLPQYSAQYGINRVLIDPLGRVYIAGWLTVNENGVQVEKHLVRLLEDGSIDPGFNAPLIPDGPRDFVFQNNKIIYSYGVPNPPSTLWSTYLKRFNEDGSPDPGFTPTDLGNHGAMWMAVQPSGKILLLSSRIFRANANGGLDATFQGQTFQPPGTVGNQPSMRMNPDGRVTIGIGGLRVIRLGIDGASDPTWQTYIHDGFNFSTFCLNPDGTVLLGDSATNSSLNKFRRLTASGVIDPSFNPSGTGFQTIRSGTIRGVTVQSDQKVLIAGDFDKVNGSIRSKLARLNADSSLDSSFQINTQGTGDRFTQVSDMYHAVPQSDGKIIVSGNFTYTIGGAERKNIVRLNLDGSIDPTFNLSLLVEDYFPPVGLGKNKPALVAGGKIVFATSRIFPNTVVPLRLETDGTRDMSFISNIYSSASFIGIYDIAVQPDGKILLAGKYSVSVPDTRRSFLLRLNSDGSIDPGFQTFEEPEKAVFAFSLLSDGKIVLVSPTNQQSRLIRLNANGSVDGTFGSGDGANGRINAISVLSDGKFAIGGLFTAYNGVPRKNFALIDANGSLGPASADIDSEVLCLAIDGEGRILLGGQFTSITLGGTVHSRSYLARMSVASSEIRRTLFDYDGDGRADLSVRRPGNNIWYLLRTTAGYTGMQYGVTGDRMTPADYDGDGKTDVAVFRPSNGTWYVYMSQSQTFQTFGWGQNGDLPVPTDRDADGKTDLVIFRPSNNTWYTRFANGTFHQVVFGVAGDKPVVGDFDADGKGDIALFRPSNNNWYIIKSSIGFFIQTWGQAGDIQTTGDFDGDGATDQAVFRPSTGQWYLSQTTEGFSVRNWGQNGDVPVAADYDGDGKTDVAIFRPGSSTWYIVNSTAGILVQQFGQNGDIPTQSAFNY